MGSCGATCGIGRERERERASALAAIARAYPGFRWRPREGELFVALGFDGDTIRALGAEVEELLPVRAIFQPSDACDWLYLLAGVHAPSLLEIADGADAREAHAEETYVRLGFSTLGPFVTIQEVVARAERDERGLAITFDRRMGVDDRRLQAIVKCLQGKLRKAKAVVLDMAFLAMPTPAAELAQDAFASAFDAQPSLFSFLFEAEPPCATRTVFADARG